MKTTTVPTFTATIYGGLLEKATGLLARVSAAKVKIHEYVNAVGLCVTFTKTRFV